MSRKDIKQIVSAANSSMKSFITDKLLGKTEKNNVFTVLSSVKEGIKNHIDSSNQTLVEMLDPILKFVET